MPVPSFGARSKRKTHAQDENAASSRIPVKSPTASAFTAFTSIAPRSPTRSSPSKRTAAERSSVPFPKSPAPAVVTPLLVDARGRVNAGQDESPRLGRRPRPSNATKTAKSKDAKSKTASATPPSLWQSLLGSGKGVIAHTFDRDLLQGPATPYCATMVTPQMLLEGMNAPDVAYHAAAAVKLAIDNRPKGRWDLERLRSAAMEYYLVALGAELMDDVAGPHFTFVDPRSHDDTREMVGQALRLMRLFARQGYRRDRIVISIPATEAGVQAAMVLEQRYGVRTNLLFVSGPTHAAICAEAGASFVMFSYTAVHHGIGQRNSNNPFARVVEALIPTTTRLADEAIERTAEHLKQAKLQSVVLLTGVPDITEAQRLKGFDSVILDGSQSQKAKVPLSNTPPTRTAAPTQGSPGKGRAREAQFASTYLSSPGGAFLSAISAETREVTQATLAKGLQGQMAHMKGACDEMLEYLLVQAELAHLDLETLESLYEDDINEQFKISALQRAGISVVQEKPIRYDNVGFRMICSLWDRPEAL
ncbi:hypothetical protein C8Q80DRAFT_1267329 [Daedaleopsis nitida]|nr:hypothetical protein C8Q80DRAFT_1267329 [Daedaleopsis nitida]